MIASLGHVRDSRAYIAKMRRQAEHGVTATWADLALLLRAAAKQG